MSFSIPKNLSSPYVEERSRGFRGLRFGSFVEEEFRQAYALAGRARARLVIGGAVIAVLVLNVIRFTVVGSPTLWATVLFDVFLLLPILSATLYTSSLRQHRLYQLLLACSALLIGLVINWVVVRATLAGMPYYFSATVAWLFVVWLILGLPFRLAAATSLCLSVTFAWALMKWDVAATELIFEVAMLGVVNVIGAFCCYQLEHALRRSFLESKILSQLAERDGLTGLHNRRSFDHHLERLWRQARREKLSLTLLLIDIDHFKAFNDLYGHQAGDDALKRVADVIGFGEQRPLDFAARYGGEEFALVLYGPDDAYSDELPEQLREDVLDLKIPHQQSSTGPYLTVSIGVTRVAPGGERSMAGAIQMADEALYQAKEQGRNQIVTKDPGSKMETGRFRATARARAAGA